MTIKTIGCVIPMDEESYKIIFNKKMQFYLTEKNKKTVQSFDENSSICYVDAVQQTKRKKHGKT